MSLSNFPRKVSELLNRNRVYWRYVTNLGATMSWRRTRRELPPEQARVLAEMKKNGVARTSVRELMPDASMWDDLCAEVDRLERENAAKINSARENPEREGHKSYVIEHLGSAPTLDPASILVRWALHPATLDIATAYFGMHVRLWQFNVWHNVPMKSEPRNSQLWHRDPGDRQILRMFVYMEDVGPGSGPLSYVPGSHELGERRIEPEAFLEESAWRSTDEMMAKVAPRETWVTATGEKGTVWFVDSRGFHKGGHVKEKDRLNYNCMWTSAANRRGEYFRRSIDIGPQTDPAVAYALGIGMGGGKARANKSASKY